MEICHPWRHRWVFSNHCALALFKINNNRASTVLSCFIQATENYGVSTRLRTDLGGENTEIWRFMLGQHPSDMPVITGSSTHNESAFGVM